MVSCYPHDSVWESGALAPGTWKTHPKPKSRSLSDSLSIHLWIDGRIVRTRECGEELGEARLSAETEGIQPLA